MKKFLTIFMLICLIGGIASVGYAGSAKIATSHTKDWYIDPAGWMSKYKGTTFHKTIVRDAEPSDWGYVSDNGVLMMDGGYIGILQIKHIVYKLNGAEKEEIASKNFTVYVVPQTVKITKVFEVRKGDLQVRWNKVNGADWYIVALGKGSSIIKTTKTFNTSKDFNSLSKGKYWVMVCAVTDIWGEELSSRASARVPALIKK